MPPSFSRRSARSGTSSLGRAATSAPGSAWKATFTPMSGRMRGSPSSLKAIRTFTVAFCRSAAGTVVMTWAGIFHSG